MRKGFYLLFCPKGLKMPKVYKTKGWAERALIQEPTYSCSVIMDERSTIETLNAKVQQYRNVSNAAKLTLLKNNLEASLRQNQGPPEGYRPIEDRVRQQRQREVNEIFTNFGFFDSPNFKSIPFQCFDFQTYEGFFDGASKGNPGPSSAGYLIRHFTSVLLKRAQALGQRTNNEAQMVSVGLLMADAYCNDVQKLVVHGDSQLTIGLLKGKLSAHTDHIITLLKGNEILSNKIKSIKFKHITRDLNSQADQLANTIFPKNKQQ